MRYKRYQPYTEERIFLLALLGQSDPFLPSDINDEENKFIFHYNPEIDLDEKNQNLEIYKQKILPQVITAIYNSKLHELKILLGPALFHLIEKYRKERLDNYKIWIHANYKVFIYGKFFGDLIYFTQLIVYKKYWDQNPPQDQILKLIYATVKDAYNQKNILPFIKMMKNLEDSHKKLLFNVWGKLSYAVLRLFARLSDEDQEFLKSYLKEKFSDGNHLTTYQNEKKEEKNGKIIISDENPWSLQQKLIKNNVIQENQPFHINLIFKYVLNISNNFIDYLKSIYTELRFTNDYGLGVVAKQRRRLETLKMDILKETKAWKSSAAYLSLNDITCILNSGIGSMSGRENVLSCLDSYNRPIPLLHFAMRECGDFRNTQRADIVQYLISRGMSPYTSNLQGQTAFEYAGIDAASIPSSWLCSMTDMAVATTPNQTGLTQVHKTVAHVCYWLYSPYYSCRSATKTFYLKHSEIFLYQSYLLFHNPSDKNINSKLRDMLLYGGEDLFLMPAKTKQTLLYKTPLIDIPLDSIQIQSTHKETERTHLLEYKEESTSYHSLSNNS